MFIYFNDISTCLFMILYSSSNHFLLFGAQQCIRYFFMWIHAAFYALFFIIVYFHHAYFVFHFVHTIFLYFTSLFIIYLIYFTFHWCTHQKDINSIFYHMKSKTWIMGVPALTFPTSCNHSFISFILFKKYKKHFFYYFEVI